MPKKLAAKRRTGYNASVQGHFFYLSSEGRGAAMAVQETTRFHPLPVIGHPDAFYVHHIRLAEQAGDVHARESHKVGRYATLAMDLAMPWDEKLRHFRHALKNHCVPPEDASPEVANFYHRLGELVQRCAGQEAVRLARREAESYRLRSEKGVPLENLKAEARQFCGRIVGDIGVCPSWLSKEALNQIRALLGRWL